MTEEVPWLRGHRKVRSYNGRATAEVDLQADSLVVHRAEPHTRLTVNARSRRFTVRGNVGGGASLHIIGPELRHITVEAPFETIRVENNRRSRTARLDLPAAVERLELSASKWNLQGGATEGGIDLHVLSESSPVHLDGDVGVRRLTSETSGLCHLNLQGEPHARVTTAGQLDLRQQPGTGTNITAETVTARQALRDVHLTAQQLRAKGSISGCEIHVANGVTVEGDVIESVVESESVRVTGNIKDGSSISARADDGPAITVGDGSHDRLSDTTLPPEGPLLSMAEGTGEVSGSRLHAPGGGYLSMADVVDSELHAAHIQVGEQLSTARPVHASTVLAESVQLGDAHRHRTRIDRLTCTSALAASGHLNIGGELCTASLAALSDPPPTASPPEQGDTATLLVTSARIRVHGTISGPVRLARARHISLSSDDDSSGNIAVHTQGRVLLHGAAVGQLRLRGPSRVLIDCDLRELDASGSDTYLRIRGHGHVGTGVLGPRTTLRLEELERPPLLELGEHGTDAALWPLGQPVVGTLRTQLRQDNSRGLRLQPGSQVCIRRESRSGSKRSVARRRPRDLQLWLARTDDSRGRDSSHWAIDIAGAQHESQLVVDAPESDTPSSCPTARVRGRVHLVLRGTLQSLTAEEVDRASPRLHLARTSSNIPSATGSLSVQLPHRGSLHGKARHQTEQTPRITRLHADEHDPDEPDSNSRAGRLLDVDINPLPLQDLDRLDAIAVLDPAPKSLRTFATLTTQASDPVAHRGELRMRAEKIARLAEMLAGRAVSGGSRAATRWALARLHHDSLPPSTEKVMRWPHRLAGYSQAPLRAGAFLVTAILAVTLAQVVFGDANFVSALQDTVVAPFTLVRLTEEPIQLAELPILNLLGFAFIAVPFLYFVIALRNYLRSPTGEDG